MYLMIII